MIFGEREMVFRSNGLRDAFEGQGEPGFMVWTYASFDPLEDILEPGYFSNSASFRIGDLVYVGTAPRPADSPWTRLPTGREIRRALVMIKGRDERGRVLVRLVQDFGGPDDGDGPMFGRVPANGGDAQMDRDAQMVGDADAPLGASAAAPQKRGRGRPRKSGLAEAADLVAGGGR